MINDLLGVYGAIIVLLVGVVGYFLNKQIKVIENLTKAVNDLNTTVGIIKSNQANWTENCRTKHGVIDRRLNVVEKDITDLKIDVARLKEDI